MTIEGQIRNYLLSRGVHSIWIDGALRTMRLSSNRWFATRATVKELVQDGERIKKLALRLEVEYPDRSAVGVLNAVYSFDHGRKGKEHFCEYVPAK